MQLSHCEGVELDAVAVELYGLTPDDFTAARNQLAKLADSEARLRLQVADLHKTVNLYEEAIRQLAIENEALQAQLAATGNVSAMRPVQPARR